MVKCLAKSSQNNEVALLSILDSANWSVVSMIFALSKACVAAIPYGYFLFREFLATTFTDKDYRLVLRKTERASESALL